MNQREQRYHRRPKANVSLGRTRQKIHGKGWILAVVVLYPK